MNIYSNRLDTYFQHRYPWPYTGNDEYDTPEEFAKAGFYNISTYKTKDKVKCYMCNLIVNNWKSGESPMERHSHDSPTCAVVILNYPDAQTTNSNTEVSTIGFDSEFMTLARLETFTKNNVWPPQEKKRRTRSATKLQSYPLASEMVEAGFIFVPTLEQLDQSKCSYCSFYLRDLGDKPDIWTQHQNYAPDCLFVKRWQTKVDSTGTLIDKGRCLSPEAKIEAMDPSLPSLSDETLKSVTVSSKENGPSLSMIGTHDTKNNTSEYSTFDDSIWDIGSVQLKDKRCDQTTKRNQHTAYTSPPPPPSSVITYSIKKRKRSAKMSSPKRSKKASDSPLLDQSIDESLKSTKKPTAMEHDLTNALDTPTLPEKETPNETAAQLLARLQKRPNRSYTTQEKEKDRALDLLPSSSSSTTTTTSSPPKRLTKNSLRLSTNKKKPNALSTIKPTTSSIPSSPPPQSSTTSLSHTASITTK